MVKTYYNYIASDKGVVHKIFSLFLRENICCGHSFEEPWLFGKIKKNVSTFGLKMTLYLELCILLKI